MSPQAKRTKKTVAKPRRKSNGQTTAGVIAGAVLVLASVLPATINPGTGNRSSPDEPPPISKPHTPANKSKTKSAIAFEPECTLPFDDIKTDGLTIDEICSKDGNAGDDVAKRLESNAKNDFCVEGTPVTIKYEDFTSLQAAADNIGGLKSALSTNRDRLADLVTQSEGKKLGEGRLVQFVAFLFDAHHSNVGKGKGELVNCKLPAKEDNDIHIELMKDGVESDPCNGVTAEMSPHFRPEAWSELVNLKIDRPVRLTGPLFFDSSHHPCHDDKRPSPNRISVWEIHPIYQFEVCKFSEKSVAKCDVKNDSLWIPLDKWNSTEDEAAP